jgi:uncharacterized membrane protein
MPSSRPRHLRPWRIVRARPRLFLSACLGLLVIAALPPDWQIATRMIVGWDVGIALYLIVAFGTFMQADVARIRRHAVIQDEGRGAILLLTASAALASLGAIMAELAATKGAVQDSRHLIAALVTIALSWAFVHTIFALHYAHEYYTENRHAGGGLAFPGNEPPDYWDFFYFSVVIGMTSQVSDVTITARAIRRTVTAHGIVAFVFNAALLALTVNIAASAI